MTDTVDQRALRAPQGYTLPLSPTGASAMVAPPPWHFSGEFIWIDYEVDPERVAAFLPPELTPSESGAAAAAFSRWQWCTDDEQELDDPVRSQFTEFALLLAVSHRDRPMARCLYAWVDQAVPMVRGWIQGMPKQFGSVRMSHTVLAGRAGPRLQPGGVYRASLAAHDRRLVNARVTLTAPTQQPPFLNTVPLAHTRVFPAWSPDRSPLNETVVSQVGAAEYSPIWTGTAELDFSPDAGAGDADFAALLPLRTGPGYVFGYGETLHGGAALECS